MPNGTASCIGIVEHAIYFETPALFITMTRFIFELACKSTNQTRTNKCNYIDTTNIESSNNNNVRAGPQPCRSSLLYERQDVRCFNISHVRTHKAIRRLLIYNLFIGPRSCPMAQRNSGRVRMRKIYLFHPRYRGVLKTVSCRLQSRKSWKWNIFGAFRIKLLLNASLVWCAIFSLPTLLSSCDIDHTVSNVVNGDGRMLYFPGFIHNHMPVYQWKYNWIYIQTFYFKLLSRNWNAQ